VYARRRFLTSVGLAGLGGVLSADYVYALLRDAGFDADRARILLAIAKRESGLNPLARCNNCVPKKGGGYYDEDSVGLFQINMRGALGVARLAQLGIASASDLLDPVVSARAAYRLWNGNDDNLDRLWYINRNTPLPYADRFQEELASLPAASELENVLIARGGGGGPGPGKPGDNTAIYAAVAAGAGFALLLGALE